MQDREVVIPTGVAPDRERSLAWTLIRMWDCGYPTRYLRFAYNMIRAREARGIPNPFDGE